MAFTLRIETDNAAFGDDEYERGLELASILRDVADHLTSGLSEGITKDVIGNTVGKWELS